VPGRNNRRGRRSSKSGSAMLQAAPKNLPRVHALTIGQFWREVAKLGGFLGRRCDGKPGWITIWRGWEKLNTLVVQRHLAADSPSFLAPKGPKQISPAAVFFVKLFSGHGRGPMGSLF
jgi:hypothetical protein